MNTGKYKTVQPCSSMYKGVWFDNRRYAWKAAIQHEGKRKHIGRFSSELEAAKAYNEAALRLHGKFARLNEI